MKILILTISIAILSLVFISCSSDDNETIDTGDYQMKINKISKSYFSVGDTIVIRGKNFGLQAGNYFVSFGGTELEQNQYLSWTDTLIKVIVPQGAEKGNLSIGTKISNEVNYDIKLPWILAIIEQLIGVSLGITLIYMYLRINKIWKRKSDREVAESQSLFGLTIYILNCILWVVYYLFIEKDMKSMLDTSIYIFEGSLFFVIGTGIFVKGQKTQGWWLLIKQALRLERKEADYLLKKFFKPQNADVIISILHQLAMIDNDLDEKEKVMIEAFAKQWNIEYSVEKFNMELSHNTENNLKKLRKSVKDYLFTEPPKEQAAQLKDIMHNLINADDKVTQEEMLIWQELNPIISEYLEQSGEPQKKYLVIIVPQRPDQEDAVKALVPNAEKIEAAGGVAFNIDTYYSQKYAEMICNQFRQQNLFTIVINPEESAIQLET